MIAGTCTSCHRPKNFEAHDCAYMRRVVFRPYRRGSGPVFTLTLWDAGERWADHGQRRSYISYKLTSREAGRTELLFSGADFSPSPMHAIDSDYAVRGLMGFLTLRPGDTDRDYFAEYTPEQRAFTEQHAEALSAEVEARFGEE